MKLSDSWLRELCPHTASVDHTATVLTSAGLEIEELIPAAPSLDGVVVARITRAEPHPNADRLQVCQVDAGGDDLLQIVCGAPNARPGLVTALATIGTRLPGDFKIKKSKIRGEVSFGMLCSVTELGLEGAGDGIFELPVEASPGTPLSQALGLDDTIYDIALTPNRGDCLSALGVARELAAMQLGELTAPAVIDSAVAATTERVVQIADPALCQSYYGRIIEGLDLSQPSPWWMQERLRRSGLRPKDLLVDITNYVQLELGQPLHAFDDAQLNGAIQVRRAQAGEQLTVLDGTELQLDAQDMVISDDHGPVALAGAMGGLHSAVTPTTQRVFLESACFQPKAMAGLGRRHKLHSEALHRFERGTDPALPQQALERASELILRLAGGRAGPITRVEAMAYSPRQIVLDLERTNAILGSQVDTNDASALLERLGCTVHSTSATQLQVQPPSWRRDLQITEDLMEEVARLIGYDALGGQPCRIHPQFSPLPYERQRLRRAREHLAAQGLNETVGFSFAAADLCADFGMPVDAPALKLANPISDQLAVMRPSLWPSMLPLFVQNLRHANRDLGMFETGRIFGLDPSGSVIERESLAMMLGGQRSPESWTNAQQPKDFFDIKGLCEDLVQVLAPGLALNYQACAHPALHPGQSAQLMANDEPLGWIGRLHPSLWRQRGESGPAPLMLELYWQDLRPPTHDVGPPAQFPASRRDLSLVVPHNIPAATVRDDLLRSSTLPLIDVLIFDVFSGESSGDSFRSIAFGLIFQDFSRTLEDGEVDAAIAALTSGLDQKYGIRLRD